MLLDETPTPDATPETPAPVVLTDGALLEAVDADGWNWRVLVISAGASANNNRYPLNVLHEAAPVYAGVPVFYGRGPDHSSDERGVDSVAGYITEPQPHPRGIAATFEINRGKPAVREAVRHAWSVAQRTGRAPFGFSHVIPRGGFEGRPLKPHGFEVTRIRHASSVDLVMSPAAGGALLAPLTESYVPDALQEAIVTVEQMLERLRSGSKLGPDDYARLAESVGGAEIADAIQAGHTPATANVAVTVDTSAVDALTESVNARIAEVEKRAALAEARATLTATLAESKLPEVNKANIAADFDGTLFEADRLTARIERERSMLASLAPTRPHGLGAVATEDQTAKWASAMDGLLGVTGDNGKQLPGFRTLKEAYLTVSGRDMQYIDGNLPLAIIAEARKGVPMEGELRESVTSGTFDQLFGDSITRRLLQAYNMPQYDSWRLICSTIGTVSDFRTQRRMRFGGYGTLPTVAQGAPYQPLTTPTDEEATFAPTKHGGTESLTMESIANDDVGALRQIPMKLARAAKRTIYNDVWVTVIASNATATYDSVALFHASHANLGSSALSAAALLATETAMRHQTAYSETTAVLGAANQPKYLVIPTELRDTAFRLTQSGVAVGAGTYSAEPNIFANEGYQIITVDEFTDANDWITVADPNNIPTIEVDFFGGNENPELFVQDQPTVGSTFTADVIVYKIRYIYAYGILDHRGFYKNVV